MTIDLYDIIGALYDLLHNVAPRMGFRCCTSVVAKAKWLLLAGSAQRNHTTEMNIEHILDKLEK
jgi:hypothetical protein